MGHVVFEEKFSSVLAYKFCPHSEALDIRSEVLYIPYASSSHEQAGNIINFVQFEEENLVKKKSMYQKTNPFQIQLMGYLHTMTLMKDI